MASFNTAYGLCSVIDSRGLLGVSCDEDGCAVITLGKNMVISCRISDQKQLNSWSTGISKLTSAVVYNRIYGNYIGVFDDVHIKQWTKSDTSMEKLKKHTMANEIQEIFLHKKTSISTESLFVLFKNGSCMELESALQSKEEVHSILQSDEVIKTAKIISGNEKFLILVVQYKNSYHLCYSVQLRDENYTIIPNTVKKVKLRRQGASMLGHCILEQDKGNSLLTFWSDGFLYSLPLPLHDEKNGVGKFLGTIHTVSRKFEVAMVPVSYNQIAIYAGDLSEEGAILGVYNIKFGLFQVQTTFKLFNKPPRIWIVENNIVILMGQRLVCVPFTLQTEMLSALACSKALHTKPPSLTQEIAAVIPTMTWEKTGKMSLDDEIQQPQKIKELLSACSDEGWSEYGICHFIFNKLLETRDYNGLNWCLERFIDLSEDFIVKLLVLVLSDKDSDVWVNGEMMDLSDEKSGDQDLRKNYINKILRVPVSDVNLLTSLRVHFKFEDCLSLLEHLCRVNVNLQSESNELVWLIVLLDAFYQQFVLSRDEKVMELMVKLMETVENQIDEMNSLKKLLIIVINMKNEKETKKWNQSHNQSYVVEKFRLY